MSITRVFQDGDLLYGLKEDVESCRLAFSKERPELKVLTQSHINKYLTVGLLDKHQAYLKAPDGTKASIASTLVKRNNTFANYGLVSSGSSAIDPALQIALNFFEFLKNNYNKHELRIPAGQCIFFKRVCKQGVMANKDNNKHIHFILDSLYNNLGNLYHIFKKTNRYKCEECHHDSVTASELRFIYRNREILKDTVRFWYNNEEVVPPWENFPEIHDLYPGRKEKEAQLNFVSLHPTCACCEKKYHFTPDDILVDEKGVVVAMICQNTQNILPYNPFLYEKVDCHCR